MNDSLGPQTEGGVATSSTATATSTKDLTTQFADAPSCHCESHGTAMAPKGSPVIALVGAPNAGKSTLFNALTGAKAKMGNWPGTTVSVSRGAWKVKKDKHNAVDHADTCDEHAGSVQVDSADACPHCSSEHEEPKTEESAKGGHHSETSHGSGETVYDVIDFPGAYSLDPMSPDEALTRELLLERDVEERPDLVIVVADTATISRGLYLAAQVAEHPYRMVVVLTKGDVALNQGFEVDPDVLSRKLQVPVVAVDPRKRRVDELASAVEKQLQMPADTVRPMCCQHIPDELEGPDRELAVSDARFSWIDKAVSKATIHNDHTRSVSERIDRVVLNPIAGPLIFLAAMWCVFEITTTVAAPLQDWLDNFFSGPVSDGATSLLQALGLDYPFVHGLIVDGLIGGVGMVLTFAPLMALMFLCLAVLEDSGYMARAAVVADRLMRAIGLPGKAFIPLIVGFGCNVPAISATRVLGNARQRILTALLVPFTSCSARLTVYVMLTATFFPHNSGSVVFAMYVISIALVVLTGLLIKNTLWRRMGSEPLVIDLPVYQLPVPRLALSAMWMRLKGFLHTAGGIIVATVIVVWLLQSTPVVGGHSWGDDELDPQDSVYGAVSQTVAPVFAPAGFDSWSLSGPLITGFVAKEAVISSWAQTYALQDPSDEDAVDQGHSALAQAIREDFNHSSGGHTYPAVWAFMVFLLAYTPCVATLAAQKREIGLKWTVVGIAIQLTVAWALAVITFQALRLFF